MQLFTLTIFPRFIQAFLFWMVLLVLNFIPSNGDSQSPFNGMSVQEVTIPPAELAVINAELGTSGSARCWRVYVCMSDPDWELQAMYGDNTATWNLSVSSSFWQSAAGGPLSSNINPSFYSIVPEVAYDSWFAIGGQDYSNLIQFISGSTSPLASFEMGSGFVENSIIGASVFGIWLPPNSQGTPDVENKILVAQFTTDGIFGGTFNFQFRKLNPDGTVFDPPGPAVSVAIQITGITVNGTPGAEASVCPIVFLPVELVSFSAELDDHRQVQLQWTTASEINNDFFTVEKSLDKEHWEEVVIIDGVGTTELSNFYSTLDADPFEGVSYYRLRQTDFNGESSLSYLVSVVLPEIGSAHAFPNPTHDMFYVGGNLENLKTITLMDCRGRIIFSDSFLDHREWSLSQFGLESGMYMVKFGLKNGAFLSERLLIR